MNEVTRIMTGFYTVEGFGPDVVEVPCTGIPAVDYANLNGAMRERHPNVPREAIQRTGSNVELRDPNEDPGFIDLDSGKTLRQLFDVDVPNAEPRATIRIGKVFFSGSPYSVFLKLNRAAGRVNVALQPRTKSDTAINFSNQIQPGLLVADLPKIVTEVLGSDGRMLELNTRKGGGQ